MWPASDRTARKTNEMKEDVKLFFFLFPVFIIMFSWPQVERVSCVTRTSQVEGKWLYIDEMKFYHIYFFNKSDETRSIENAKLIKNLLKKLIK